MTGDQFASAPAADGATGRLMASGALVDLARRRMMRTYPETEVVFVRGEGVHLFDADGGVWLDFLSGIAVTNLGHAHPAVTDAVMRQVGTLVHTSNLFLTQPALELADRLAGLLGWDDARTFFAQCGATANEAAIKLARRHGRRISRDKIRLVTLSGSFHGRTLATLEATGQPAKHTAYQPLAGFVDTVAHDDPEALRAAIGPNTCGVLLEVVQGEGGVRPLDPAMLAAARAACDEHDALLMFDEVQTGVGRTGAWFAFQGTGVVPDVITLAKALGNGLPIGACVARGVAAEVFAPGDHATTFGGNPVTAAGALAVLDAIVAEDVLVNVRAREAQIRMLCDGLVETTGLIREVRGAGLLLGIVLREPLAAEVERRCRAARLIVNAVAPDVIRLAPPLIVRADEVAEAFEILQTAIVEASRAAIASGLGANDPEAAS